MIIWRGWGILAFLAIGLGVGIAALLGSIFGIRSSDGQYTALIGIGLVVGGVASYIFGQWMNVQRPEQRKVTAMAEQRARIDQLLAEERFHAGPEFPWPSSKEEARAQADFVLAQFDKQLSNARNQHTLFFIPMQYIGILMAVGGVVLFVLNIGK